jgi:hypothetical protein
MANLCQVDAAEMIGETISIFLTYRKRIGGKCDADRYATLSRRSLNAAIASNIKEEE